MGISILEESIRNSSSSRRDFLRITGKTVVGAAFLSTLLKNLEARGQLARIIVIDTGWSFDEITAVLRGEPAHGSPGAQSGDTALFSPGDFEIPMRNPRVHYKVEVPNLIARGTTYDSTRFIGASPLSGLIFETRRDTITLSDFRTENSAFGIKIDGINNFDNINLQRIKSFGHRKHYLWDEQNADHETTRPSIFLQNCYLIGGETGTHFQERNGATPNTKYLSFRNVTADNLDTLVNLPLIWGTRIIKGEFSDSIVINSGAIFPEDIFWFNFQFQTAPRGFVEWNNESISLYERGIGRFNIESDPLLEENGRPRWPDSPAIGRQYLEGYAGAIPPKNIFGRRETESDTNYFTPTEIRRP